MTALSVLAVASEAYPLIKTGGLADVAGALPAALVSEGVRTRTLVPGYPAVLRALAGEASAVHNFGRFYGGEAQLLSGRVGSLDVLALRAPHLYERPGGPYSGPNGRDWPDNAQRFAALARAAEQLARGVLPGYLPDAVHAHDWQAGLVPAFLHYGGGRRPGCVFTIHNMAFQGQFPAELLAELGLPPEAYAVEGVEYYGSIGYLKAGIHFANRVTTVSPTYASELTTDELGMGLGGLLRERGGDFCGILNGLDEDAWNPATDERLPERFSAERMEGRAACRAALLGEFGLDAEPRSPVLGVVSRLSWQKGIDLLGEVLPSLVERGWRVAILGTGEATIEEGLRALAAAHAGVIGLRLSYDERLAHVVQAGSDVLAVPSRFEPCGLTQLSALRYGALPLVSRTGGLADTVIDANEAALAAGVATGVQFWPLTRDALRGAFGRASSLWEDTAVWRQVQRNGMQADVGWKRSAERYARLYRAVRAPGPA